MNRKKTTLAAVGLLLSAARAVRCPFGHDSPKEIGELAVVRTGQDATYPSQIFAKGVSETRSLTAKQYGSVVHKVIQLYEARDASVGANHNPRQQLVGCLVRLAGHDFLDFRRGQENAGGSDGCLNFEDPDNAGLPECIAESGVPAVYAEVKDEVSLADFLVIAAEALMGRTATDNYHEAYDQSTYFRDGTYAKSLRDSFKFGRKTVDKCDWNIGRLPNPENGCHGINGTEGLEQIFVDNIYHGRADAWALTAAISGAHTVGRAKPENSGYDGFWSDAESSGIFNNDYYGSALKKGWGAETSMFGNPEKNQWKRVDLGADRPHKELMLTSDICLAYKNQIELVDCIPKGGMWGMLVQKSPDVDITQARRHMAYPLMTWLCAATLESFDSDLDPRALARPCCAWAESELLRLKAGIYNQKTSSKLGQTLMKGEFCGAPVDPRSGKPVVDGRPVRGDKEADICCTGSAQRPQPRLADCDERVWATGPAWDDMVDFLRDEGLWLRKYAEAWHAATENGHTDLSFLNPTAGPARAKASSEEEQADCAPIDDQGYCGRTAGCYWSGALAHGGPNTWLSPGSKVQRTLFVGCSNRHRLQSAQLRENFPGQTSRTLWRRGMVDWAAPTQSETEGLNTADRPLGRQDAVSRRAAGQNWGAMALDPEIIREEVNRRFQRSCSVTKASPDAWWKAKFVGGEKTLKRVTIWTLYGREDDMLGAEVWIGEHLLGVVSVFDRFLPIPDINRHSAYSWELNEGITGDEIRVVHRPWRRAAAAPIIICDVMLFEDHGSERWLQPSRFNGKPYVYNNNPRQNKRMQYPRDVEYEKLEADAEERRRRADSYNDTTAADRGSARPEDFQEIDHLFRFRLQSPAGLYWAAASESSVDWKDATLRASAGRYAWGDARRGWAVYTGEAPGTILLQNRAYGGRFATCVDGVLETRSRLQDPGADFYGFLTIPDERATEEELKVLANVKMPNNNNQSPNRKQLTLQHAGTGKWVAVDPADGQTLRCDSDVPDKFWTPWL